MTVRPPTIVEYGAFQQPPSLLFRDYLQGSARAASFYEGGRWDLDALAAAAAASRALPRRTENLAQALVGQQAGLFGGPLYVLYKALAAIKAASVLEARLGTPVVPVFWVAADDHDFAE